MSDINAKLRADAVKILALYEDIKHRPELGRSHPITKRLELVLLSIRKKLGGKL